MPIFFLPATTLPIWTNNLINYCNRIRRGLDAKHSTRISTLVLNYRQFMHNPRVRTYPRSEWEGRTNNLTDKISVHDNSRAAFECTLFYKSRFRYLRFLNDISIAMDKQSWCYGVIIVMTLYCRKWRNFSEKTHEDVNQDASAMLRDFISPLDMFWRKIPPPSIRSYT